MIEDAKSLAPPEDTTDFAMGCFLTLAIVAAILVWLVAMLIISLIASVADAQLSNEFMGGSLVIIGGIFIVGGAIYAYRFGWFSGNTKAVEKWQNGFRCNRCGHRFEWYG